MPALDYTGLTRSRVISYHTRVSGKQSARNEVGKSHEQTQQNTRQLIEKEREGSKHFYTSLVAQITSLEHERDRTTSAGEIHSKSQQFVHRKNFCK